MKINFTILCLTVITVCEIIFLRSTYTGVFFIMYGLYKLEKHD